MIFGSRKVVQSSVSLGGVAARRASTAAKAYPPSMQDKYVISSPLPVPQSIIRPNYVGKRRQEFPSLNGSIQILTEERQEGLRVAANLAARTLQHAMEAAKVGMTLDELDKVVHDFIVGENAYPSAIDFMHFPKSVCLSVNDVVSHGVPNDYTLAAGDYLNIDVVCYKRGCHGDNSAMVFLEDETTTVHEDIKRLAAVTREAMFVAIDECRPGTKFDKIGALIEDYAHGHGYYVNQEFGGHGIGTELHMAPLVHHQRTPMACQAEMRPGMAFTIEPILHLKDRVEYLQFQDGWTMQAPGNPSCQWEHIVLVTEEGSEILTMREGETWPFERKLA